VGGTATLAVDGFFTDCNLYQYGPYAWSVNEWWVENPSVISLSMVSQGSAQMSCLSVGQSQFWGNTIQDYYDNDGMDCYVRSATYYGGCCTQVKATVTVTSVTLDPTLIGRQGAESMLKVNLAASTGLQANSTVTVEAFVFSNPSQVVLSLNKNQDETTMSAGQNKNLTFTVTTGSTNTIAGDVTFKARITGISDTNAMPLPADGVVSGPLQVR
jgi:hypothetical protein